MDNLNDIFNRAKSCAGKWVEASKERGPCDKRKIEELLKKRREYLGLQPRKFVWCLSVAELEEGLKGLSADSLLPKDERKWRHFMKLIENQLCRQLRGPAKRQYPSSPLYEIFADLRGEMHNSLSELFACKYKYKKDLQKALLDKLWNLFTSQKKSVRHFSKIDRFWDTLDIRAGAYYDCLWHCLPERDRLKNYFAYLGEAYGEGLAFLLPAKGAELLLPSPERAFEDIIQEAVAGRESKAAGESQQLKIELDAILEGLVLFENRLSGIRLPEEVLHKALSVVQILRRNILALRKDFPSSSLCWEAGRIAKSYLPNLLESFANLSEASRSKKLKIMLLSLEILGEELQNISELIESRKIQDFEVMANFLEEKFKPSSFGI